MLQKKKTPKKPKQRFTYTLSLKGIFSNESALKSYQIMPTKKNVIFKYSDSSFTRNAAGTSFLVFALRPNDLYDPDPLVLTGSVSNFKELMVFYSYYRVLEAAIKWTIVNNESFPLSCGIVFSQTNLTGVIGSAQQANDAFENDFATPIRTLSGKGGLDRTTFILDDLDIGKLLGVPGQYRNEGNYAGVGLATPSIPLWANFIVWSTNGASLTNGFANTTTIAMLSELFGRINNRT